MATLWAQNDGAWIPMTGGWSTLPPADMGTARFGASAVRLQDDRVLIIGGADYNSGNAIASCEIYDPATKTFSATGALATKRYNAAAHLLADGRVVVIGGSNETDPGLASCEIFDPAGNVGVGSWSATGSMITARQTFNSVMLASGNILVVGGFATIAMVSGATALCEIYTPGALATGAWAAAAPLTVSGVSSPRYLGGLALLSNGTAVMVAGRNDTTRSTAAAIFDPAGGIGALGSWTDTGSIATGTYGCFCVALNDGTVLMGLGSGPTGYLADCQIFTPDLGTPANGTWGSVIPGGYAAYGPTAVKFTDGTVLVCGGSNAPATAFASMFDSGSFTLAPSMTQDRYGQTMTLLADENILVAGGEASSATLDSSELFSTSGAGNQWNTAQDGSGSWVLAGPGIGDTANINGHSLTITGDIVCDLITGASPSNLETSGISTITADLSCLGGTLITNMGSSLTITGNIDVPTINGGIAVSNDGGGILVIGGDVDCSGKGNPTPGFAVYNNGGTMQIAGTVNCSGNGTGVYGTGSLNGTLYSNGTGKSWDGDLTLTGAAQGLGKAVDILGAGLL